MTYVYIDRKPDGTPFYVGIGTASRVKSKRRNNLHSKVCKKYPEWTREIVEDASRELCEELEVLLISEIGRQDKGLGPLVNFTDGGEGVVGHTHSEHVKQAIRDMFTNPEYREAHRLAVIKAHANPSTKLLRAKIARSSQISPEVLAKHRTYQGDPSIRERKSADAKLRWADPEYKQRQLAALIKSTCSKSALEKRSVSMRGKNVGKCPLTSPDLQVVFVSAEVAQVLLTQGYVRGDYRRFGKPSATSGRVWVNNGSINKIVSRADSDKLVADGWVMGRKWDV